MEKLLALAAAVLMMFAFTMVGLANDQNMGAAGGAGADNQVLGTYTGEVVSVDRNAHTIAVKGDDGDKTFDVSRAHMEAMPETHSIVTVKYGDMKGDKIASSVIAVSQKEASNMRWLYEKYISQDGTYVA